MILPLRRKHPITVRSTAPATPSDASRRNRRGARLLLARRAACGFSLALCVAWTGSELLAGANDGRSNQSTVQWSTAKKKAADKTTETAAAPSSSSLKWRARKSASSGVKSVGSPVKSEPRAIDEPVDAAPLATIELRLPTGQPLAESAFEPPAAADVERPAIVLTTGEAPVVDPFADPFGDSAAKPAKPSELKLFPVMTAGTLQTVDGEESSPAAPEKLDAPDESLLEEMQVNQAPAEEMPSEDLRSEEPSGLEPLPSDEELAQNPAIQTDECPAPRDLKPIREITNKIAAEPGIFPQECTLGDEPFQPRNFAPMTFTWKASALCHKPLYFEQVGVERYGHTWGPFLQPVVGSAHFFGSVILLPYKMGVESPCECIYPLGYYRPGSCAPYTVGPVPISLRGALAQAGATLGFVYIFAP